MAGLGEEDPALGQEADKLQQHGAQPDQRRLRAEQGQHQQGQRKRQHLKHPGHAAHGAGCGTVKELAGVEGSGRHAHGFLHQLRFVDAGGRLQG